MITHESIEHTDKLATQELIHELRGAVAEAYFDRLTRMLYSTDASIYQNIPVGVVKPRDSDEVAAAVEIAGRHDVPILPRGGGSSLDGQATANAVVIDMTRYMNQVVEINTETRSVRSQPGITVSNLNAALAKHGLQFGPDPASAERATVGGIVGNNSTGAHSIVYGMTSDHVIAVDAILSDGSRARLDALDGDSWQQRGQRPGLEGSIYRAVPDILKRYAGSIADNYPKTWRTVAGYNLNHVVENGKANIAKLVVGSEGTLAVTTEATLNLVPLPRVRRLVLAHFSELRAGLEAVPEMLKSGPTAIELIDRMMMDLTRNKVEYRRLMSVIEGNPAIILIVEYSGETESELDAGVDKLRQILKRLKAHDPIKVVADPVGQANIWFVRKVGLGILMSVKGDIKPLPFIEDAAVPVQHLANYVDDVIQIVTGAGLEQVAIYAHASAGCLHLRPMINLKTAEGVRQMRQIAEGVVGLVHKYDGTLSGEHGEGLARGEFSERMFGADLVKAFHEVKAAFDPDGLMNPGKIVDVAKMDDPSILRFGPDYATPLELQDTVLSFKTDGGFARAVELCNGAGVCRKIGPGVMCPSFIATRDEAHATRGRANALRSAMMGMLGPDGMTSKEVYNVMDLCLSCKACKSECPSSVDMAKIKSEFLHNYQRKHGVPLRSRVFTHIATLNKLGQPLWPVANVMLKGPAKWVMAGLGVHAKRSLPPLAPQTFSAWFKRHAAQRRSLNQKSGKEVVLFHDTFMEYNHPAIGHAAVSVLETAGFDVILVEKKQCCGRPAVSKGMLDEARRMAQHNIALLAPYAERGIPIVGCEPSCLAMLVDEYPDLVPGTEAKAVASVTLPIEDFLSREAEAGRIALHFEAMPRRILLHGHCNQKALFGTAGTKAALKLMPDCVVDEVETSCCGMAGSFGYETEHYDLSVKLAEMSLAPAVRNAPEGALVAAPGTSCREQIHHTTRQTALHPIEILAEALTKEVAG